MRVSPFFVLLLVAAALFVIGAFLEFTDGGHHPLGWGLLGLAAFALAGLWAPARNPV